MNSGGNKDVRGLQFAAFWDNDWGTGCDVLIVKLFQPSHNCINIPAVKERSEIFRPTITTNSSRTCKIVLGSLLIPSSSFLNCCNSHLFPNSERYDGQRQLRGTCSGVTRGCVNSIRLMMRAKEN